MVDLPAPIDPLPPGSDIGSRADFMAVLKRLDGWGDRAWAMAYGAWRLTTGTMVIEPREGDADPLCTLIMDERQCGSVAHDADAIAVGDWALRRCWKELITDSPVRCTTLKPTAAVRATSACVLDRGRLLLRLVVRLPYAGMCCDGERFARFVRRCERFLRQLSARMEHAELSALRRAIAIQHALRAALPEHGLTAFIGVGSRLARSSSDGAADHCRPLRVPRNLSVRIDLGRLGIFTGLGIRCGVTAIAGAAYHGKSTVLQALAAGRDDHRPGDGRELTVCDPSVLAVHAEDGRPIKAQDLSPFFARLPGGNPRCFTSDRASGATSMAASVLQGIAAGCTLLVIDEDSAAGNFLWLDPAMRRLLGRSAAGGTTLVEALPALAARGISTVLAVGSATPAFAAADRVLLLEHFQPRLVTAPAKRLAKRLPLRRSLRVPPRHLESEDILLGERHFLRVDAREPERPKIMLTDRTITVDLRRCGWPLDEDLVRGACCAAAWCVRLSGNQRVPLPDLKRRYEALLLGCGPRAYDPFNTSFVAAAPWPLVATILERITVIPMTC